MRLSKKATTGWMLKRADEALDVTRILLSMKRKQSPAACFHSKWAAEEFFLTYLFNKGEKLTKVEIRNVLRCCKRYDKTFSEIETLALFLSPFGEEILYPNGLNVNVRNARRAIKAVEEIRSFVLRKIGEKS